MNLHEYQGKELLSQFGVAVQQGNSFKIPLDATAGF